MLPQQLKSERKEPSADSRVGRGIKTDRIFRVLLCSPEGTLTKYRISKLTGSQQTPVSVLLRDLEESNLVKGTRVIDYRGLLNRWSQRHVRIRSQSYMLPDILDVLKNTGLKYALTTYQAESIVNHYLFPTRTELYVRADDFEEWHGLLVKQGALVGGGNVRLRWYDDQVFYNAFFAGDYRIVTIPQLIVDLLREGGVAVQAVEMMIEKYKDLLRLNQLHQARPSNLTRS